MISTINCYNLQSEDPLADLLQESTWNLYQTLLACFIKPYIIPQGDNFHSNDIGDSNYKDSSSVHIGSSTNRNTHYLKILLKHQNIINFFQKFTSFMLKLSYLLKSMSVLHDPTLKCLCVFLSLMKELTLRRSLNIANILISMSCIERKCWLHEELLDYQTANKRVLQKKNNENNKQNDWSILVRKISLMEEAVMQIPYFPNLSNLTRFLLIIPRTNCFCNVFSSVKKILSDPDTILEKMQ